MENEDWRTLRHYDAVTTGYEPPVVEPPTYGEKTQAIRDSWEQYQEARRKNLRRDMRFMDVFQLTDTAFQVVNYKTLTTGRGVYDVDMDSLQCSCPDGYYTFADEGSNVVCKHTMLVALVQGRVEDDGE